MWILSYIGNTGYLGNLADHHNYFPDISRDDVKGAASKALEHIKNLPADRRYMYFSLEWREMYTKDRDEVVSLLQALRGDTGSKEAQAIMRTLATFQ